MHTNARTHRVHTRPEMVVDWMRGRSPNTDDDDAATAADFDAACTPNRNNSDVSMGSEQASPAGQNAFRMAQDRKGPKAEGTHAIRAKHKNSSKPDFTKLKLPGTRITKHARIQW